MPKRDPALLIRDMLTAISRIERYTQGKDHDSFIQDQMTRNRQNTLVARFSFGLVPELLQQSKL